MKQVKADLVEFSVISRLVVSIEGSSKTVQCFGVAEAERADALVCGTGDRGFEFPPSPQNTGLAWP